MVIVFLGLFLTTDYQPYNLPPILEGQSGKWQIHRSSNTNADYFAEKVLSIVQENQEPWRDLCCYEKGRTEKDGIVTILYYLEHENLQVYNDMLKLFLTPKGFITVNQQEHLLMIRDAKENIPHVENAFLMLHGKDLQVMIEAKVVEVRWDKKLEVGFEGGDTGSLVFIKNATSGSFLREIATNLNPTSFTPGISSTGNMNFSGIAFRFRDVHSSTFGTISATLRTFLERGQAQVLTNPKILCGHHSKATIFSGDETPYLKATITPGGATAGVEYIKTGVTLDVTPHIISKSTVKLTIKPEVKAIRGFTSFPIPFGSTVATTIAPITTTRYADTSIVVEDGEEIVIAGLIRRDKVIIRKGVPILMDIPILGFFFSKTEESDSVQEVIFLIRPRIITHSEKQKLFEPKK